MTKLSLLSDFRSRCKVWLFRVLLLYYSSLVKVTWAHSTEQTNKKKLSDQAYLIKKIAHA